MTDYRRFYLMRERQNLDATLTSALAALSAEVDRAAVALDRPGGRAIRNRLVKAARLAIDAHRLADNYQIQLDELLDLDSEPAQVIAFPKARAVELRVVRS